MANTYVDYTATAAQTDFAFSFPYLEDSHVTVEINGAATTDFTIVTTPSTKIVLDSGATAGNIVRVRRKSQPGDNLVDFVNGSVLTESELDRAYLHNRYLAEEIAELNDASLQQQQGGTDWDGKTKKIKNVVDPVDAQDAATKNYVDTNDALKLNKAGDTMSGALAMGGNKVTGLGAPSDIADATTKTYVDNKVNQASTGATFPPVKWTFTGTAGANTTYTVTDAEVDGDTAYDVSIDGSVQEPTTDFTVDPDTDTLTIVPTLSGGEDIVVIQRGFGIALTSNVGESNILDNSVTTNKIANSAVTEAKIDDNAVTTNKIANSAVTADKTNFKNITIDSVLNVFSPSSAPADNGGYGGLEVGGPEGGYLHLKSPASDDYDAAILSAQSTLDIHGKYGIHINTGDPVATRSFTILPDGKVRIGGATNPAFALDVTGDVNITGDFKVNGANFEPPVADDSVTFAKMQNINTDKVIGRTTAGSGDPEEVSILDEDTMTSNSDTALATQQSIKAYVDAQTVSKYTSSWFNDTTGLANGGTYTFTHNLGTKDINVTLWMATDSSGSNQREVNLTLRWTGSVNSEGGAHFLNVSTTQLTVQLAEQGWLYLDSNGDWQNGNWGTTYTHIKVVAIG